MLRAIMTCFVVLASCEIPDPEPGGDTPLNEAIVGEACAVPPSYSEDVTGCPAAATDYQPRVNSSADDTWPACISDDNSYHRIQESISSISRVEAFDSIGALLWLDGAEPTAEDFVTARILFEEDQGLGSRVARRYDIHYSPPAGSQSCSDEGVANQYPDYCVGPATLQPMIVDAFAEGAQGKNRIVNAARIKAALEWFFYVSTIKEGFTCTQTPKDCDSSWAYYCGGTERGDPIGLAHLINTLAPATHNRAYDGVLAVRCWKNLDHEDGESTDLTLRDQALAQLDQALVRGVSVLVRQRFAEIKCSSGDYQQAAFEGLKIMVPLLDRATRELDSNAADSLLSAIDHLPNQTEVDAAAHTLDTLFACP